MSRNFKRRIVVLMVAFCTMFLISCNKNDDISESLVEGVKLEEGAIIQDSNSGGLNLNLEEDKYTKIKTEGLIIDYDYESDRYIYYQDGKHKIFYDGKVQDVKAERGYNYIKLSPAGKYLSYFIENEGLQLVIQEIGNDKKVEYKSEVAISGNMVDWLDEKRLVYYGVDMEGNNGVFIYDIDTNEERLVYKLDEGFIQFIKSTHTGVVFLQEHNDKGLALKRISLDTEKVEVLTTELDRFSDVVERENEIYVLGKAKNDVYSLYRIDGDKLVRLVYDFPTIVKESTKESKKLSIDKKGNILFVGATNNIDKEEVYAFSPDGTIKSLILPSDGYSFVQ